MAAKKPTKMKARKITSRAKATKKVAPGGTKIAPGGPKVAPRASVELEG